MHADRRASARRGASVLGWAVALLGLWIVLTDNTRPLELVVGAACSVLAAAALVTAARLGGVRLAVERHVLIRLVAVPWWIVRDSVRVLGALVAGLLRGRPPVGRMRAVPFDTGGDDAAAQGRRAVAMGAGSMGPNQIVIAAEDGVLVVHELVPAPKVEAAEVVRDR